MLYHIYIKNNIFEKQNLTWGWKNSKVCFLGEKGSDFKKIKCTDNSPFRAEVSSWLHKGLCGCWFLFKTIKHTNFDKSAVRRLIWLNYFNLVFCCLVGRKTCSHAALCEISLTRLIMGVLKRLYNIKSLAKCYIKARICGASSLVCCITLHCWNPDAHPW